MPVTVYRKAAKTAPARPRPRPAGAAVAMIAALAEAEELLEPELEELEPVLELPDPVAVRVTPAELLRAVLVELPLLPELPVPMGLETVTMPEERTLGTTGTLDRPAGIEAAGVWERIGVGCPVTTPRELVWVR